MNPSRMLHNMNYHGIQMKSDRRSYHSKLSDLFVGGNATMPIIR